MNLSELVIEVSSRYKSWINSLVFIPFLYVGHVLLDQVFRHSSLPTNFLTFGNP
jgi:hypothetical protein